MITDLTAAEATLGTLRQQHHPECVVCNPVGPQGLRLRFEPTARGVRATFACAPRFVGYPGLLHGGITAALLDGAMTNCLFRGGHVAVTAELNIRYRHPVVIGVPAQVEAWIAEARPPLFHVRARLEQAGKVRATATAAFLEPGAPRFGKPAIMPEPAEVTAAKDRPA